MINKNDSVNNNTVIPELLSQNSNDLPENFQKKVLEKGLQQIIDSEVREIKENYQGNKSDVQIKRTRKVTRMTTNGTISLNVPYLKNYNYYPSFLEKYQRRDSQLNELISNMVGYCGSTRNASDWCFTSGIGKISPSTISRQARKNAENLDDFNKRDLSGENILELKVDAMYFSVRVPGLNGSHYHDMAIVRAMGHSGGTGKLRHLLVKVYPSETAEAIRQALEDLKKRNLKDPLIVTSDSGAGVVKACRTVFPYAIDNICLFHEEKGIFATLPRSADPNFRKQVCEILQAQSDEEAKRMLDELKAEFTGSCYKVPIKKLESTLGKGTCCRLTDDEKILKKIRTTSQLENMNGITRRRIDSIRCFPSIESLETYVIRHCLLVEERWDRNFREDDPELPDRESLMAFMEMLETKQEAIFQAADEIIEGYWKESQAYFDGNEFKMLIMNIVHVPVIDIQGAVLTIPLLQVFGDNGTEHKLLRVFVLRNAGEAEIRQKLFLLKKNGLDRFKRKPILLPYGEKELQDAVRLAFPTSRIQYGHDSFKKTLLAFVPKTYQEEVSYWLDLIFTCKDCSKAKELLSTLIEILEMHLLKEAVGILTDAKVELLVLLEEGLTFKKSGYVDLSRFDLGTGSIFPYWSAPSRKPNSLKFALELMYSKIYQKSWDSLVT